ncbi:MAG: FAD-dependent oxidoreductase [Gordonibacter sp.]
MGEKTISRRNFLAGLTATGALAAAGALAGCAPQAQATGGKGDKTAQLASWRDKPEPITDIAETIEVDLVVVGAGNGGLPAATTAAQNGAKVIVLEKGGNIAAAREAIGALNSKLEPDHQEDVPALLNHANMTQSGDANMVLYKTWAEKSGEMMEWMKETLEPKGMLFPFEWHRPDPTIAPEAYYPAMCYNPCLDEYNTEGPNYSAYLHLEKMSEVLTELGGEIRLLTPAKQLVQDESGKVTGVIATDKDGKNIQFNAAKGVIMCTGGYGANEEMLKDLVPVASEYCVLGDSVTEEGDGIRMALWAGAYLEAGGSCMIWNRGLMNDDTEFGRPWQGQIFLPGSQPFLHVNANGERFMNEDQCYPMSYAGGLNQPGHFSWEVWDASYWEDIVQFDTCGCSRLAPAPAGTAFNADVYDCEAISKEHLDEFWFAPNLESGAIKKADTLDELAKAMGLDAEKTATFAAAVARYNEMAAAGKDTDFGKEPFRMSAVNEPPYYAARIAGELLVTTHGVVTNANSQPLREDGSVIVGLYVCGNDQGGFYPHNYPSNFTGINAGRTATFGRIAAKHALGAA